MRCGKGVRGVSGEEGVVRGEGWGGERLPAGKQEEQRDEGGEVEEGEGGGRRRGWRGKGGEALGRGAGGRLGPERGPPTGCHGDCTLVPLVPGPETALDRMEHGPDGSMERNVDWGMWLK